jgi:hypothetical protein
MRNLEVWPTIERGEDLYASSDLRFLEAFTDLSFGCLVAALVATAEDVSPVSCDLRRKPVKPTVRLSLVKNDRKIPVLSASSVIALLPPAKNAYQH